MIRMASIKLLYNLQQLMFCKHKKASVCKQNHQIPLSIKLTPSFFEDIENYFYCLDVGLQSTPAM